MAYGSKVASIKSRISSIDNLNNGGNKKAGFPYLIGRGYQTSIFFHSTGVGCGDRNCYMKARYKNVSPTAGLRFTSSMGVDHR
jgi:hypothetical protein